MKKRQQEKNDDGSTDKFVSSRNILRKEENIPLIDGDMVVWSDDD